MYLTKIHTCYMKQMNNNNNKKSYVSLFFLLWRDGSFLFKNFKSSEWNVQGISKSSALTIYWTNWSQEQQTALNGTLTIKTKK